MVQEGGGGQWDLQLPANSLFEAPAYRAGNPLHMLTGKTGTGKTSRAQDNAIRSLETKVRGVRKKHYADEGAREYGRFKADP